MCVRTVGVMHHPGVAAQDAGGCVEVDVHLGRQPMRRLEPYRDRLSARCWPPAPVLVRGRRAAQETLVPAWRAQQRACPMNPKSWPAAGASDRAGPTTSPGSSRSSSAMPGRRETTRPSTPSRARRSAAPLPRPCGTSRRDSAGLVLPDVVRRAAEVADLHEATVVSVNARSGAPSRSSPGAIAAPRSARSLTETAGKAGRRV
jgi:hypothetical protein